MLTRVGAASWLVVEFFNLNRRVLLRTVVAVVYIRVLASLALYIKALAVRMLCAAAFEVCTGSTPHVQDQFGYSPLLWQRLGIFFGVSRAWSVGKDARLAVEVVSATILEVSTMFAMVTTARCNFVTCQTNPLQQASPDGHHRRGVYTLELHLCHF